MDPILAQLAAEIQKQAAVFLPKAYQTGKLKGVKKYGIVTAGNIWNAADNANVALLLNRHADELKKAMVRAELQINAGVPVEDVIFALMSRLKTWSWVVYPAMALGMVSYVDQNRTEIHRQENVQRQLANRPLIDRPNDIGIIWEVVDAHACKVCLYLAGRWFDAKQAYDLAAKVHPNCRCPQAFRIGTPDEALVGPVPGYRPGTSQDIYNDLNVHGLTQSRINKARAMSTPRGEVPGIVWTKERMQRERARNTPRAQI